MDNHIIVGLIPRGLGFGRQDDHHLPGLASTVSVPRTTTGPGTGGPPPGPPPPPSPPSEPPLLPLASGNDDYRNYQGHKYSNKKWNQQLDRPVTGAQPGPRTLSQALAHPQSDLAEAPRPARPPQLDPSQSPFQSQSHWHHQAELAELAEHQAEYRVQAQAQAQALGVQQGQQQHDGGGQQHGADPLALASQIHPHSRPHSSSAHAAPHQNQPYHYRHASQPPRLPPLAASLSSFSFIPTSSFDPFRTDEGDSYFLSFGASPSPATPSSSNATANSAVPRLPAQTDDIVSPISETRSSTPAFRSFDRASELNAPSPAAAQSSTLFATISALKRQPTSNSSAHASLLDDKDFELTLGVTERPEHHATPTSRFTSAAITSAVAQDVAHLTDERSDDWFRFTARESTLSKHTDSLIGGQPNMTVAMTADESAAQEQQQQPQSSHFTSAPSSSFTPLPPIRRTSTFDVLRKKGLVDYDSDTAPSPIEKDSPAMPSGPVDLAQQVSNGQLSASQGASRSSPHNSVQEEQQQQQQQQQHLDLNVPSQSQPAMPQYPQGVTAAGPAGHPGMLQYPGMQMHPHQMAMGPGGAVGQQVPHGQMMINGQGQTILSLPGGRRWTEQKSTLAEPLNPSNRNRPANSPRTYTAYDKETEGEGPPSHFTGGSSQPVQTRPRNVSNSAPPTAATRFPSLFPHPGAEQPAFPRNHGQLPTAQNPLMRRQNPGLRDSLDEKSLSNEMDVASTTTEDINDKPRRGSGALFNLGHKRNSSSTTTAHQAPADVPLEKKKNFFQQVTGMGHSHPKNKTNLGPARTTPLDQSDQVSLPPQGDHVQSKKKLSELKGMIKGVGNAKEGAKDDQPVRVETVYESRESMQSPPRNFTAPQGMQGAPRQPVPFGHAPQAGSFGSPVQQAQMSGPQVSIQPHPSQMGQPGATSPPPFMTVGRASTSGPQPSLNHPVKGDDSGKKGSAGGFLGGLFSKQGNKAKDAKPQSPQQMPPSGPRPPQPPMQAGYLPFRPGQMQLPGQQLGPHPMLAGQPPVQRGPPGQSPSPTLFHDPTLPSPSVQTAQAVAIRRPSEITVSSQSGAQQSSNQRPGMGSPRASSGVFKQQASPASIGPRSGQMGPQNEGESTQTSPQLSDDSPLEGPAIGNLGAIPRASPNRKPVGGGNPRGDVPTMTSAISPAVTRLAESPSSSPGPGQQRAPSQLSHVQQSPQLESSSGFKDMRQPSLPSPGPSPAPSQSNQSTSSRLQGDQFSRDSPDLREPGQGIGGFPNGLGLSGPMNSPGYGGAPNGLPWGPNGVRPSAPPLISPSAAARAQPSHDPSSPVPSMDQGKLSKFFGAYDGGKPAAQPQANKEKSAASKFLGAFKRSSKQNETIQHQERPQTSPRTSQQGGPGSGPAMGTLGPSGMPTTSGIPPRQPQMAAQPGQGRGSLHPQIAAQQVQGGRGQLSQIPPQGIPTFAQAGRGQIPPGMMAQGGRGQMPPPMFAGASPMPPQMQRPATTGKQGNERQYDQVPIPRGYEAVHGYGPGGMLAFSPYNAGRPGQAPIQYAPYAQYPPALAPGFPQGQWDPRMMPFSPAGSPPGAVLQPGAPRFPPQGVPNSMPYQVPPQHPQLSSPTKITSPTPQAPQPPSNQGQQAPGIPQSYPVQQLSQPVPSVHGQMPTQFAQGVQLQQGQPQGQGLQREPSPDSKPQPYSWSGTPQNTQSPATSVQQLDPPTPNLLPQTNVRAVSSSASPASNGMLTPQSQHTAATAPSQPSQSQPTQATLASQTPPVNRPVDPSGKTPPHEQSQAARAPTTSSNSSTNGLLRSQDAARLTSRMSVSKPITTNVSSEKPADRTLTVSPEPSGPRHGPIHQVSEQNLGEGVNTDVRDDIYDATPRLDSSTPRQISSRGEDQAHENTKYAASDHKGHHSAAINGAIAGVGLGVIVGAGASAVVSAPPVVTEDNMSFLDGPDSEPDENKPEEDKVSPPPQIATTVPEPEEKILVDQPVELAAVNDVDDGIPMMSATSYPGQEWNPYGAGEFGDWE
ncbi:hypothetical protein F5B22DRAFT_560730 [Xylaria bambusicola]|uniref:uncharacterized protein n=1 Tax=Xylaria bambusicola TaxID=326684 RepID=UPI002007763F|nr:uncharacterized protein F5B22DRAFT_560730 [Xylaria bambusicola]KAI0503225.1 hypothetical protein F5B22DRAFT_560730 [Xylaria bambusicola]